MAATSTNPGPNADADTVTFDAEPEAHTNMQEAADANSEPDVTPITAPRNTPTTTAPVKTKSGPSPVKSNSEPSPVKSKNNSEKQNAAVPTNAPTPASTSDEESVPAARTHRMSQANATSARCLRRMKRAQTAAVQAAHHATVALANAAQATASLEAAKAAGVDAGVLSPPRLAASATRESLAVALVALKITSEDHHRRRERTQNALAVGTFTARELVAFIENDDGSLEDDARADAQRARDVHEAASDSFDTLDSELVDPYTRAPALPPTNADVEFVSARYFALLQEHDEAEMAVVDYTCKEDPDADSDGEEENIKKSHL